MAYAIKNNSGEMVSLDWYLQNKRSEAITWTTIASQVAYFPSIGRAEDVLNYLAIEGKVVTVSINRNQPAFSARMPNGEMERESRRFIALPSR